MYFGVHFTLDNIYEWLQVQYRNGQAFAKPYEMKPLGTSNLIIWKKKDKDKFETVWFLAATLTSKNTIRKQTSFILWKIWIQ